MAASTPEPSVHARRHTAVVACLVALTFSTGIIDALSWLGLNRVFTANMTGNVLIIGMGAAGAGDAHWLPPLVALCLFLLGAATIGVVRRGAAPGWDRGTTVIFGVVGASVLAVAIVTLIAPPVSFAVSGYVVMAVLSLAMGVQGAEAMRLAVPQLITVAVSSAVVGLGMALFVAPRLMAEERGGLARRIAAIVALGCGAVVGSVLLRVHFAVGLAAASIVILAATAFAASRMRVGVERGEGR